MTRRNQVILVTLFLVALPVSAQDPPGKGGPLVSRSGGQVPECNTEKTVSQGEVVFLEYESFVQKSVTLSEPVVVGRKMSVPAGQFLLGFKLDYYQEIYCFYDREHKFLGKDAPIWVCFTLGEDQQFSEARLIYAGNETGRRKKIDRSPSFEFSHVSMSPAAAIASGQGPLLDREITYLGTAGGILRFLYREKLGDEIQPESQQELTYGYTEGKPFTVSVQGADIEILAIGNSGMTYRVLNGFR